MSQPVLSVQSYNRHVCRALDKTLSVLGEAPRAAMYYYFEETCDVMSWEIPQKIETIEKFIEDIFGHSSAVLKRMFYTNLRAALGDVCVIVPLSQYLPTLIEYNRQNKKLKIRRIQLNTLQQPATEF